MNSDPVSRRTRSKAPIKSTSERGNRAQLRAGAAGRIGRSPNDTGGPGKRRKKEGKSSKKRTKAKNGTVLNQSLVTDLQQMPDDVLVKIVDFVAASDGTYLFSGRKITEDDLELGWQRSYLREEQITKLADMAKLRLSLKKLSSPSHLPVASLFGVAFLHRSLSPTSKRMQRFVAHFIDSVLIDADLFGVPAEKRLSCLLWMLRKKPNLSRLRARTCSEAHLLATLLVHCGTSDLRACDVKLAGDSYIRNAWIEKFRFEVVDLASEENTMLSRKTYNELLWDLDIARTEYIHSDMADQDFYNFVAAECSCLEVLSISMEFNPYETRLDSRYAAIMSSPLLKYIDLNINLTSSARHSRRGEEPRQIPIILYKGLTKAISLASNLRGLRLGPAPYINDKYGFKIESESLELIDTVDISKNTFVLKCKCPNLQHFFCNGEGYASGLLPEGFDVTQSRSRWNPRWTDDSLPASAGFFGLEAHEDCIVHLKGYRALRYCNE
mmetsp:Transcript_18635/g.44158  ORF Transcript_18635/g.44158 Transcript_18635/m.44158 type:complete len:496 (+) Transcript_18635:190-1677(+)